MHSWNHPVSLSVLYLRHFSNFILIYIYIYIYVYIWCLEVGIRFTPLYDSVMCIEMKFSCWNFNECIIFMENMITDASRQTPLCSDLMSTEVTVPLNEISAHLCFWRKTWLQLNAMWLHYMGNRMHWPSNSCYSRCHVTHL